MGLSKDYLIHLKDEEDEREQVVAEGRPYEPRPFIWHGRVITGPDSAPAAEQDQPAGTLTEELRTLLDGDVDTLRAQDLIDCFGDSQWDLYGFAEDDLIVAELCVLLPERGAWKLLVPLSVPRPDGDILVFDDSSYVIAWWRDILADQHFVITPRMRIVTQKWYSPTALPFAFHVRCWREETAGIDVHEGIDPYDEDLVSERGLPMLVIDGDPIEFRLEDVRSSSPGGSVEAETLLEVQCHDNDGLVGFTVELDETGFVSIHDWDVGYHHFGQLDASFDICAALHNISIGAVADVQAPRLTVPETRRIIQYLAQHATEFDAPEVDVVCRRFRGTADELLRRGKRRPRTPSKPTTDS
jgi:hypothetical protein